MHKNKKIFLLSNKIKSLIDDLVENSSTYEQFYTKIKLCKEIYYTKQQNKYTKTMRSGIGYAQEIHTKDITKNEFQSAKKSRIGKELFIQDHQLFIAGKSTSIYEYKHDLDNLFILHVPFEMQEKKTYDALLKIMKPYIIADTTDDPRYQHKHLALLGDPSKHTYNIYSVFKDIELSRIHSLDDIIFKEMRTSDAIRIKLFYHLKELDQYQTILSNDSQNGKKLKNFRKALKQSKMLIEEFATLFDDDIFQKIYRHLEMLIKLTKKQNDLFIIKKNFQNINKTLNNKYIKQLIDNLNNQIKTENSKISKFFLTREFAIIHRQYELFIRENNRSYLGYDAQISIGYSLGLKLKAKYHKLLHLCTTYEGCNDKENYEKVKKDFDKYNKIYKEFNNLLDSKQHQHLYKMSKQIVRLIKKHQKQNKTVLIITTIQQEIQQLSNKEKNIIQTMAIELMQKQKKLDNEITNHLMHFKKSKHKND